MRRVLFQFLPVLLIPGAAAALTLLAASHVRAESFDANKAFEVAIQNATTDESERAGICNSHPCGSEATGLHYRVEHAGWCPPDFTHSFTPDDSLKCESWTRHDGP